MTMRATSWWVLVWHAVIVSVGVIKIHAFQSSSTSRGSVQSPGRKIVPRGFLTTTTRLGGRTRPSSTLPEISRMRGPHPSPPADSKSMDFWQENDDNNNNNNEREFVPAKFLIGTTPSSTSSFAKVEDPAAVSRSSEKETMRTALLPTMDQFLRDENDGALLRQVDTTLVGVDAESVFATPPTTTTASSSLSAATTNNNNESIHQYSAGHTSTDEEQQQTCSSTLAFKTWPEESARIGSESAWPPVMDVRAVEHVIAQAALATATATDRKTSHGQELCNESHDDTATTPQKPMEMHAAVSPNFIGDAVNHADGSIQGTHRRERAAVDSREPSPSILTARITPEELSSPIDEAVPNVADGLQLLSVETAATESTTAPSVVLTELPLSESLTRPIRDSSEPNSHNGFTVALTNGVSSLSLPAMNERDAADTTTVVSQGLEDWNSDAKRMASRPSVPAAETIERKRIGPPEQAPPKHLYWSTCDGSPDQFSNQVVFPAASGGHTASNHDLSKVSAGKTIWSGIAQPGKTSFFPVPPNEAPPTDQWNWDAVETSVDVITEKSKQSNDEIGASWLSLLNIGGEKESKPFANGKLRHRVPIPPQEPPPRSYFDAGDDATAATDAPIVDSTGAVHATNPAVGLTTPPSWYSPVPPNEPPPQTVLSRAIFPHARDDSGSHDIDGKENDSQLTTGTSVLQRQVSNAIKSGWETFTADKQHISTVSKRRTPQENQISSPDLFFLTVASPTVATNDPKKTGNDSRKDDYNQRNIEPFFTFDIMPGVPLRQIVGAALVGLLGAFYLVDWLDLLSMMTIGFDNFDWLLVVLPFITATLAITKGNGGDLTRAVGDVAASSLQLAVTLSREAARTILKFSPENSTVQEMMAASAEVARQSLMATTVAFDHWRQGDQVPADSVDECIGREMDCERKMQAERSSRRLLETRLEIDARERSQRRVPLALGLVQERLQTEERDEYDTRQSNLAAKRHKESQMRSLLQARLDMEAAARTRRAISVAQTQESELRKDQQMFAQKLLEEQVDKVKKARQRALAHVQQVPDTVQQTKDERSLGLDQQPLVLETLVPVTFQQKQEDDMQSAQKVSDSLRTKRLSKSETLHQAPSDDASDVHRRLELLRAEAARVERRRRVVERTVEGLRTRAEKRQRESEAVQAREVRMRYRFGLEAKKRKEALLDRPSSPMRLHAGAANPETEIVAHQRKMLDLNMKVELLARDNMAQGLGTRKRKAALLGRPSSSTHAAHDIAPKPKAEGVASKRQMLDWKMNGAFVARDRAQGLEAKTRKEVLLNRPSSPTRVAHAVAPKPKTEFVAHERETLDWKMKEELLARERAQKRVLAQMRMEMAKTAASRKIQQEDALDATRVSRKLVGSGGDVKGVVGASSRSLATDKPKTEPSRLSRAARHLIAALPAVAAYVDNVDASKP